MSHPTNSPLSRRRLFAGAGAAGALAAVAVALPRPPADPLPAAAPRPVPESGGGYQLTAHVQHYYRTAKV